MSRHRAVRNLDLEEEFYDEEDGAAYDELQDLTDEEQIKLQKGLKAVKDTLGPNTGIEDQDIKESLWYYYFDEAATIAWLRSSALLLNARHRPGNHPAQKRQKPQTSITKALTPPTLSRLAGLAKNKPAGLGSLSSLSSTGSSLRSLASVSSGSNGLSKLSLGSLSSIRTSSPSATAESTTANSPSVVGKALAALKTRPIQPASLGKLSIGGLQGLSLSQLASSPGLQAGQPTSKPVLKNFVGRQLPALKSMALPASRAGTQDLAADSPVASAQPSLLANFILNGVAPNSSNSDTCESTTAAVAASQASLAVVDGLKREIQELLGQIPQSSSNSSKTLQLSKHQIPAGHPSLIRMLVDKSTGTEVPVAPAAKSGKSSTANNAPAFPSSSKPAASAAVSVSKEIGQLKIGDTSRPHSQQSNVETHVSATTPTDESSAPPQQVKSKKRIDVVAAYSKEQKNRETLNLVVVGHVDAGKSTLMGHLLYAMGQVNERAMRKFERDSEKIGKGSFAYAWVLDETEEERSRGVTMDIATSSFSTKNRKFTLLDAPGHRDFVPNMISGASRADVAILVVDASTGEFESGFDGNGQTREHAILIRSLGVRQLVVAVNKMDVVGWSQERYDDISGRLLEFLTGCGYLKEDVRFAPVSGLKGVNLVRRIDAADGEAAPSELTSWYKAAAAGDSNVIPGAGPCLVDLIDTFTMPERPVSKPFRLAVTDFFKGGSFSSGNSVSVSGRIAQGHVQVGEQITLVPSGATGVVKSIDVDYEAEEWAVAGDSVVLMIQDIDIQQFSIGSVVCASALTSKPIQAVTRLEAQLVVFDPQVPITNGFPGLMHIQSLNVPAVIHKIIETFDQRTGEVVKKRPRHIRKGATARVEIRTETPVCLELFKDSKDLGRVMLRKNGETIAAGIVTALYSQ
ncbi:hypothetical protein LPJ66_005823 [Kickxella alabastrina]|uniref:Uncharacterized protein n=1 Tax=Kickxella alabastrina TaxID=61397 RepID=A0ACC1IHS8_9FUNG|nr:hypothetical protein LPJ66_005823 [Kickxella alabastrina]